MSNILKAKNSGATCAGSAQPIIMGVLNVTTDSFSDGGKFFDESAAIRHAAKMLEEGADIIDVGAESTRPGARLLSAEEELAVLLPRLKALKKEFPKAVFSVDTYKPEVALAAADLGAEILNDVVSKTSGETFPMARVARRTGAKLVITHNSRESAVDGADFAAACARETASKVRLAQAEGVDIKKIIIDPGFGFGKTPEQNFGLVKNLSEFGKIGCPVLLGVSRKSALGLVAGGDFCDRDVATCAVSALVAFMRTADIIRVHDVKANLIAVRTALKLL